MHKFEAVIQESEQRLINIINFLPDATFVIDKEGKVISWNLAMEKITGIKAKDMLGKGNYEYSLPFYGSRRPILIDLVLQNNVHVQDNYLAIEYTNEHLSAESFCPLIGNSGAVLYGTASPLCNSRGETVGAIESIRDISERKKMEENLRRSEANFRLLANTSPAMIFVIHEYRFVYVNSSFLTLSGYSKEDLLNINSLDLVHPDFREMVKLRMRELLQGKNVLSRFEIKFLGKDNQEYWIDYSANVIEYNNKPAIIATAYDITERKQAEEALRASEQKLHDIISFLPDATMVIDTEGKIIAWNRAMEKMTGIRAREILGKGNYEYAIPFYGHRRPVLADIVLKKGEVKTEDYLSINESYGEILIAEKFCPALGESGAIVYAVASPLYDTTGQKVGSIESIKDITERSQAEEQIKWLSYHDKLTGLYNRAFFEEELKRLDNEQYLPLSLIIGDINGLKIINDAFGHQGGDIVLKKIAAILQSSCDENAIIVRWGGDEFVMLLPSTSEVAAVKICKKIRNSIILDEIPLDISISLGVACKEKIEQNMNEVSKEAEDRMYRSKLLGSRSSRSAFINSLERTLWTRSHETQAHTRRLRKMVVKMGQALSLPDNEVDNLTLLAALHDIGKIAIPNSILDKPGKLSKEEWEFMKKHTEIGYRIALSSPELAPIAESILAHHERWDGRGYPLGIRKEQIPRTARILSIIDAYDVMVNGRPYQMEICKEDALEEIRRCAGTQFDPELAKVFIELMLREKE